MAKTSKSTTETPDYKSMSLTEVLEAANATEHAEAALKLKDSTHKSNAAFGKELTVVKEALGNLTGCKGRFSEWLKVHKIARRTAYYAMDAAKGIIRDAKKKKLTKKQKAARTKKAKETFKAKLTATLAELGEQKARTFLNTVFSDAFAVEGKTAPVLAPEIRPEVQKFFEKMKNLKPQQLDIQLKAVNAALEASENFFVTPAGRLIVKNADTLADLSQRDFKAFKTVLDEVQPAAQ